jgi:hypothetical protein
MGIANGTESGSDTGCRSVVSFTGRFVDSTARALHPVFRNIRIAAIVVMYAHIGIGEYVLAGSALSALLTVCRGSEYSDRAICS